MIAKTYKAKNIQQALDQIKSELGADAMILSTQQVASRRAFGLFKRQRWEVTAGIKEPPAGQKALAAQPAESSKKPRKTVAKGGGILGLASAPAREPAREAAVPNDPRLDALLEEMQGLKRFLSLVINRSGGSPQGLRGELLSKGLSAEAAERIIFALRAAQPNEDTGSKPEDAFHLDAPAELTSKERVISLFAGPSGSGKTTTLVKIAAHARARYNKRVAIISTDVTRIGKHEQLAAYGQLLDIPVYACSDYGRMNRLVATLEDDLVLIDTPGLRVQDSEQAKMLRSAAAALEARVHIVVSATTRPEEFRRIVANLGSDDCKRVLFTRLDELDNLADLAGEQAGEYLLSYFTDGEDVPADLVVPTADDLAKLFAVSEPVEAAALAL